jgi:hypothetical protein
MNRRRLAVLVAIVLAAFVLAGAALVAVEARTRVAVAYEQSDRVAATQSVDADYTRDFWSQPHIVADAVIEAMLNDAMPGFLISGDGASVSVRYGAFGGASFLPVGTRPWAPPFSTTPLAVAAVLAITATLVAASRWSPPGSRTERERPGRPAGS